MRKKENQKPPTNQKKKKKPNKLIPVCLKVVGKRPKTPDSFVSGSMEHNQITTIYSENNKYSKSFDREI